MLNTTAEYALRAVVFLANAENTPSTNADIAEATGVPTGYLSKVLQSLARHGIVKGQRGLGGGFRLARKAEDISVLDVMEAVDSPIQRIERCPLGIESHQKLCPLHRLVDEAMDGVERAFASASISDLVENPDGIAPLCGGAAAKGK